MPQQGDVFYHCQVDGTEFLEDAYTFVSVKNERPGYVYGALWTMIRQRDAKEMMMDEKFMHPTKSEAYREMVKYLRILKDDLQKETENKQAVLERLQKIAINRVVGIDKPRDWR